MVRRLSELLRIFEDRDLRAVALFGSTYAQKLAGEVKEVRPDLETLPRTGCTAFLRHDGRRGEHGRGRGSIVATGPRFCAGPDGGDVEVGSI